MADGCVLEDDWTIFSKGDPFSLENKRMVLLSIFERGGFKAGFKKAVEVSLIFKPTFEGDFENTFIRRAEEPCGVVDPQAVNEFGRGDVTVFAHLAGGMFLGTTGKTDQSDFGIFVCMERYPSAGWNFMMC